jgi:CelD/BcsL family acetyltransferase involved in cellulose biosynthesis
LVTRLGVVQWTVFQPSQLPLGAAAIARGVRWQDVLPSLSRALPGYPLSVSITQQDPDLGERPEPSATLTTMDYGATGFIDVMGSFDDFWAARGKNLRQNLRKQRRKLEEQGHRLTFEYMEDAAGIDTAFLDFARLESAGWKADSGTAISLDNAQGRFYRDMLRAFAGRQAAFAIRLSMDDRPIAVDFGIREGTTLVILKTTYDENLKGSSPGQLLHEQAFEHIFKKQNPSRIEFYGKMMEWHTRWTDTSRMLFHLNYDRLPILRRIHGSLKRLTGRNPVPAAPTPSQAG